MYKREGILYISRDKLESFGLIKSQVDDIVLLEELEKCFFFSLIGLLTTRVDKKCQKKMRL